jgi:myo-inositol-1(or 4)-monophosphatase
MTPLLRSTLFLALKRAGKVILLHADRPNKVSFKNKSSINLVTQVDGECDRLIRRTIQSRFPDHDFLTEESTPTERGSAYKWIIDPLDGTTNYAHHFPQVGVSIGLEYTPHPNPLPWKGRGSSKSPFSPLGEKVRMRGTDPEVVLAGVFDPFRDELFWAEKGRGAYLKKKGKSRRLHVSSTPRLNQSLLLTGFPYDRRERADLYLSYVRAFLREIQGIRRAGAAALDLCWVACGRVDGYWEWRLKPWDMAAGSLIVREAGGQLSDFSGRPHSLYGEQTLATNRRIHREMLKVMSQLPRVIPLGRKRGIHGSPARGRRG